MSLFENDLVVDNFSSVHENESFYSFRSCSDVSDGGDVVIGTSAYKSYTGAIEIFKPNIGNTITNSPAYTELNEGAAESVPLPATNSNQSVADPAYSGNYTDASTSIVDNMLDYVFLGSNINDQSTSRYGFATALTDDGKTLVVGAPSAVNDDGQTTGAIFVYSLEENEGQLEGGDEPGENLVVVRDISQNSGSNSSVSITLRGVIFGGSDGDEFGSSVDMSRDGSRIIVGSRSENDQSGVVRVYEWYGDSGWGENPSAYVFAGSTPSEHAGWSVSISGDGNVIAFGSPKGGVIGGGSVAIFEYGDETGWQQLGSSIQGSGPDDMEGYSLSLSHDGSTLVSGAPKATSESGESSAGRARIFKYDGSDWAISGVLDGEDAGSQNGSDVAISLDGSVLVVGGKGKSKNSRTQSSGHCRVFELIDDTWQFLSSMKGQESEERLGSAVAISSDMSTVACGGTYGVTGDISKGVVRLWNRKTSTRNSIWPNGGDMQDSMFGHSISFSEGGKQVLVGAPAAGAVQLFHSMSLGDVFISTAESEQNNLGDEEDVDVDNDGIVMNEM